MTYCSDCGEQINSEAKFCESCGTPTANTKVTIDKTININVADSTFIKKIAIYSIIAFVVFIIAMEIPYFIEEIFPSQFECSDGEHINFDKTGDGNCDCSDCSDE